ncbi:hypothetical protein FC07_GL000722 [Loigolactobacillus bifermentans DSM 20003]|uniref:Uncharacterized protein n=2 Tax=Loigolactobacillus bifermentans TaxID=1607 RepID=A0A0R1GJB0_9LACO|nr:hypothetical protein FC07_GL000722 [Loigolactobacillus bifermentans DSM 20003]
MIYMAQWIYVVFYENKDTAEFEVIKAFKSEQRAIDFVKLLMYAPFERHSLEKGFYTYRPIPMT